VFSFDELQGLVLRPYVHKVMRPASVSANIHHPCVNSTGLARKEWSKPQRTASATSFQATEWFNTVSGLSRAQEHNFKFINSDFICYGRGGVFIYFKLPVNWDLVHFFWARPCMSQYFAYLLPG
jgi:hypothetical protein